MMNGMVAATWRTRGGLCYPCGVLARHMVPTVFCVPKAPAARQSLIVVAFMLAIS